MKNLPIFLLILSCCLILACNKNEDVNPESEENRVKIRIENNSTYKFESVTVTPIDVTHNYGDLAAGEISDYFGFEKAYPYGLVTVNIGTKTLTAQPIDFIGETLLNDGEYTWRISIQNFDDGFLDLELVP